LSGEPTIYPNIGGLIAGLRARGKTSFLVTNGLHPEKIKELKDSGNLPTQLYISINTPNEKLYNEFHKSSMKDAWKKLNESLALMKNLSCRTIFRMNLVKDLNMNDEMIEEYAEMIKKANPMFVEVKGYMSVGFARERLGYDRMPDEKEMEKFISKLAKATGLKILDSHERSRAWVLGEDKDELKIR